MSDTTVATPEKKELLSTLQFTETAIRKLRKEGRKGIHSVYSGFNNAFKKYYANTANNNPVDEVNKLIADGKIASHPTKGGVSLYLLEDAPQSTAEAALSKMGL